MVVPQEQDGREIDEMYMNHPDNKNGEWDEEKQRNREAYKKGRSQSTRDCGNSTGSSGSGKCLIMCSQIQPTFCTDGGMS